MCCIMGTNHTYITQQITSSNKRITARLWCLSTRYPVMTITYIVSLKFELRKYLDNRRYLKHFAKRAMQNFRWEFLK